MDLGSDEVDQKGVEVLHFYDQVLKKCEFSRKLIKISHGLQVEDNHSFMMSQKEFVFLEALHSPVLTIAMFT